MGAERAVIATQQVGTVVVGLPLGNFHDEIVVKMDLREGKLWILMGRVVLRNSDDDGQYATARLIHNANVPLDEATAHIPPGESCFYLQAGLAAEGRETVTLECNTYSGGARHGSIIAFAVDHIDVQ